MNPARGLEAKRSFVKEWGARVGASDDVQPELAGTVNPASNRTLPSKIWELEQQLLCPIIGTCVAIEAVHRLARKHALIPARSGDFEAHVAVINHCKSRNALSRDVQRSLDRCHALWVDRFAKLKTEEAVLDLWSAAVERGEAAGAMWGALTCRASTPGFRQRVYEDIHMLSHQMGAGIRANLARTVALEKALDETKAEQKRGARRTEAELSRRDTRIRHLEVRLAAAEAVGKDVQTLRLQLRGFESGEHLAALGRDLATARAGAAELARKAERAEQLERRLTEAEAENTRLVETLQWAEAERDALERALDATASCVNCDQQASCPHPNFAGRRLLCVGGRTNLQVQYRVLVERAGGTLICHDGGREEGLARLPELLGQANAVICPVDCIGHAAYYQVKRHCKAAGKPWVMLRSSGLGSFAEGLCRLANGRWVSDPYAQAGETAATAQVPMKA